MTNFILTHSIFLLSYCNQHMPRTDTSVRKQLTFRESSCFLDIFTRLRESLQTFPFRSFLFYILRPCYNQLLPSEIIYFDARARLEKVFAWKFSFPRPQVMDWNQRLERIKSTVAFVWKKSISLLKIRPCKMKGGLGASHLSPFCSRIHRDDWNRRGSRRKTADLYFFVRGAAGRPVSFSAWAKSRLRSLYWVCPPSIHKQARRFISM